MKVLDKKLLRKLRLANLMDNLLSRGFASLVGALFLVAIVIVLVAALAYFVFCARDGMTVPESFWSAFAYTINPELPPWKEVDSGAQTVITLVIVIVGLLVTSALIGIMTTALTSFYEGLRRGFSPVLEEGHVAIIGFNDNVQTLISELRDGYAGGKSQCFVLIDDKLSREQMERRLAGFVGMSLRRFERETDCRIVCRNANLRDVEDLRRCAVERASSIIINNYDDSLILKTLLAVTSLMREEKATDSGFESPITVCTFRESQFARAAEHTGDGANLRVLSLSDTLSSLIAKTCYQPGLSSVLSEIYSYEGSELYIRDTSDCVGMKFDDLFGRFKEAVPLGIWRNAADGAVAAEPKVFLNAPLNANSLTYEADMMIQPGDELVVLSHDGRDLQLLPKVVSDSARVPFRMNGKDVRLENANQILVVGYDETFDQTIVNLARYYHRVNSAGDGINCTIKLLYRIKREPRVMDARQRFLTQGFDGILAQELDTHHGTNSEGDLNSDIRILSTRVEFQCAMANVIDLPILENVFFSGEVFKHVIVLSDLQMNQEEADTETLLTLLYLKAIAENAENGDYSDEAIEPFRITSEIQNMDNLDLAYNEYVSDYIISWKFIAALQVQIAEHKHRYRILQDLLKPGGADIQLEPAKLYIPEDMLDGNHEIDFDELSVFLRTPAEPNDKRVLLGYVSVGEGKHHLCPVRDGNGNKPMLLAEEDMLIVLKAS